MKVLFPRVKGRAEPFPGIYRWFLDITLAGITIQRVIAFTGAIVSMQVRLGFFGMCSRGVKSLGAF